MTERLEMQLLHMCWSVNSKQRQKKTFFPLDEYVSVLFISPLLTLSM